MHKGAHAQREFLYNKDRDRVSARGIKEATSSLRVCVFACKRLCARAHTHTHSKTQQARVNSGCVGACRMKKYVSVYEAEINNVHRVSAEYLFLSG